MLNVSLTYLRGLEVVELTKEDTQNLTIIPHYTKTTPNRKSILYKKISWVIKILFGFFQLFKIFATY